MFFFFREHLQVMQIFICIVTGIPVMRTPLQILFLILVTDLPPSIALDMEPGGRTRAKKTVSFPVSPTTFSRI